MPDKNLHAFVPPTLLNDMQQAAQEEGVTADEFVSKAIADRLEAHGFDELLAFGKRHARERGLRPSDVATAIAEVRKSAQRER